MPSRIKMLPCCSCDGDCCSPCDICCGKCDTRKDFRERFVSKMRGKLRRLPFGYRIVGWERINSYTTRLELREVDGFDIVDYYVRVSDVDADILVELKIKTNELC
jgi:hypothetical protein